MQPFLALSHDRRALRHKSALERGLLITELCQWRRVPAGSARQRPGRARARICAPPRGRTASSARTRPAPAQHAPYPMAAAVGHAQAPRHGPAARAAWPAALAPRRGRPCVPKATSTVCLLHVEARKRGTRGAPEAAARGWRHTPAAPHQGSRRVGHAERNGHLCVMRARQRAQGRAGARRCAERGSSAHSHSMPRSCIPWARPTTTIWTRCAMAPRPRRAPRRPTISSRRSTQSLRRCARHRARMSSHSIPTLNAVRTDR